MFCLRHLEKYRENNTNVRMSLMGEVKCRPVDWTYLLRGMRTPAQLSRTWRGTRLFTMSSLVTPVPCTIFACLVRCNLRKNTTRICLCRRFAASSHTDRNRPATSADRAAQRRRCRRSGDKSVADSCRQTVAGDDASSSPAHLLPSGKWYRLLPHSRIVGPTMTKNEK